jgi:hypothetical protein
MHLRQRGDWTSALVALSEKVTTTSMWMEGPYGSLSVDLNDVNRYQMALLVSGGIGVTPCQSIGKSLLYQHLAQERPLKYMKFVWAVRDMNIVREIPPLGGKQVLQNCANVEVDIYCTRSKIVNKVSDEGEDVEFAEPSSPSLRASEQHCNAIYGQRPDLDTIFIAMKQKASDLGEHSIAVIGCGPPALMHDLNVACRKYSESILSPTCGYHDDGVFFDLHMETFEF